MGELAAIHTRFPQNVLAEEVAYTLELCTGPILPIVINNNNFAKAQAYRAFRGRDPQVQRRLHMRGLLANATV